MGMTYLEFRPYILGTLCWARVVTHDLMHARLPIEYWRRGVGLFRATLVRRRPLRALHVVSSVIIENG